MKSQKPKIFGMEKQTSYTEIAEFQHEKYSYQSISSSLRAQKREKGT